MFLQKDEFISTMPNEYKESLMLVKRILARCRERVKMCDDPEIEKELLKELGIVREMYFDMLGTLKTVKGYYEKGGNWDQKYCFLAWIRGSELYGHGSTVERLVISRIDSDGRRKQFLPDAELETLFTEMLKRLPDCETEGNGGDVLLQGYDTGADSEKVGD